MAQRPYFGSTKNSVIDRSRAIGSAKQSLDSKAVGCSKRSSVERGAMVFSNERHTDKLKALKEHYDRTISLIKER